MRIFPLLFLVAGCSRPPPAPVGLDDSARYLMREFYEDDATIGAGLTGFMDWFDAEGSALVGEGATAENVDGFQLAGLDAEDIAMLPVADDGRDLTRAYGVVALADMDCPWQSAEALLIRADQEVVFAGDFETYDRTYLTSRDLYDSASDDREFVAIDEAIPILDASFDPGPLEPSFLMTENHVSAKNIGVTVTYDMVLQARHGIYDIQGVPTTATLIITSVPERGESTDQSTLAQSYSIEFNLDRDGRTLRVLAIWTEIDSPLMAPDSALVLTKAVNQIRDSAARMTGICQGEIAITDEP